MPEKMRKRKIKRFEERKKKFCNYLFAIMLHRWASPALP